MIDVKHKVCEYESCNSRPSFNTKGCKPKYCTLHKSSEMVDVTHIICKYEVCNSINPVFDINGGKGSFCNIHKNPEMVDVRNKKCEYNGCNTRPNFGIKGSSKATHCSLHKSTEMVDNRNKKCKHDSCNTQPAYGIKGGKAYYCVKHKTNEMIDVNNKLCEKDGCNSLPIYGIKGGKAIYCVKHKTTEMINLKSRYCIYEGCNCMYPTFNIKGEKGAFCFKHKTSEMIDVKNKMCIYKDCKQQTRYGKPGNPTSHCANHKEKGMIRKSNSKCSSANCKERAIWGINWKPLHCETHKTADDQNLVEKPCSSCGLMYILDKVNKCENCNPESWARAVLAKQNALMDYLDAHDLKGSSTDTIVDGGICGKERPDRVYDFGDRIVILECDEDQHKGRACVCEQTRMINIGQMFGGVPVYFIRWNPDKYKSENNKEDSILKRHKLCNELITHIKMNKTVLPYALVSAIYLYYDGWSSIADEKWEVLMGLD